MYFMNFINEYIIGYKKKCLFHPPFCLDLKTKKNIQKSVSRCAQSEEMAVGIASDADVTTAAHVRTREVCMSHLLHPLKISYVFTSQDEHNASLIFISCRYGFHHEGSPSYQQYCKFTYNFCICKRFKEVFLLLTLFLHQILI